MTTLSFREVDPESISFWGSTQPARFRKLAEAAGLQVSVNATISTEAAVLYLTSARGRQFGDIRTPEREQENLFMVAVRLDDAGAPRDAVQIAWADGKMTSVTVGGHILGPTRTTLKITDGYTALKGLKEYADER